jgi:hypothetical protein
VVDAGREAFLRSGGKLEDFYQYTPFQTSIQIRAWIKNRDDEIEAKLLQAYHTAQLSLTDPKHFPETFRVWFDGMKPKKPQTAREASAAILMWARKNGLKDYPDDNSGRN